jgi:hypothetical protein
LKSIVNTIYSRGLLEVTTSNEVSRVDNILRNTSTVEEPGLVSIHQRVDSGLEPGGKDFGAGFCDAILEGDRPELRWVVGPLRFRKEDKVGFVNTGEVNGTIIEGLEHVLLHFLQQPMHTRGRATSCEVGLGLLIEDEVERMVARNKAWRFHAGSNLKMLRFGMEVEIVSSKGMWSEVSQSKEAREEGTRLFQAVLIKTRYMQISVGISRRLDQVNFISRRGSSMRPSPLIVSLNLEGEGEVCVVLILMWWGKRESG